MLYIVKRAVAVNRIGAILRIAFALMLPLIILAGVRSVIFLWQRLARRQLDWVLDIAAISVELYKLDSGPRYRHFAYTYKQTASLEDGIFY